MVGKSFCMVSMWPVKSAPWSVCGRYMYVVGTWSVKSAHGQFVVGKTDQLVHNYPTVYSL